MPGQYIDQYEMLQLITDAARSAIQKYGIQRHEEFIWALMAVAYGESPGPTAQDGGPTWDTQSVHDGGQGFSLFALHNQGYAGDLTPEQRQDPMINAQAAADKLGSVWDDNASFQQNLGAMTGPAGQNPQNPAALYENSYALMRILGQVGGEMGSAAALAESEGLETGVFATPLPSPTGAPGGQGGDYLDQIIAIMGLQDDENSTAREKAELSYLKNSDWWDKKLFGDEGAALTPEEQEQQRLTTAGMEIETGLWPYSIEQDEFDNTRQYYLDQVASGQMQAQQAINAFNAWLAGTQEATKRAETLMEREQRTLPVSEFPLTEQGGMLSKIAEGYGLPWTPWKGVPIEQMTSPEAAFSRFQRQMGLSQQAPEMVPYDSGPVMEQYGQAVGAQSQGAQAAIDFVRGLLQKRGVPST